METEKQVEAYLKKRIEGLGGICYKFVSPGRAAVPDRICVIKGFIFFVECKGEKGRLSKKQLREIDRLQKLKASTFILHTKREVDALMRELIRYVII